MARALLGHLSTSADLHVIEENARLKRRVAALENEVAELRSSSVSSAEMFDELHRMTVPALA